MTDLQKTTIGIILRRLHENMSENEISKNIRMHKLKDNLDLILFLPKTTTDFWIIDKYGNSERMGMDKFEDVSKDYE